MNNTWYFEYDVTIIEDDTEEFRQGIICAKDFSVAASDLNEYYQGRLIRINKLYRIMETFYEFNNEATDFQIFM